MSREPGEPGSILDHEGEGRQLTPRSVEPETWHPQHHEIGPMSPQGVVVQAELLEHTWGVVLDHDIACRNEPAYQIDASRVTEVDGHALLIGVERGEDRPPLPELILRLWHAADQTRSVRPGRRFEVDHLRAEERQHVARQRAGPVRGHVQDPQALERKCRRRRRRRGASTRFVSLRRIDRVLAESEAPVRAAGAVLLLPAGRVVADSPRRRADSRRTSPGHGSARRSSRLSRSQSVRWGSGRQTTGRAPRPLCAQISMPRSSAPAPCGPRRASDPPSTRGVRPLRRSRATVARYRTRDPPAHRVRPRRPESERIGVAASVVRADRETSRGST